MRILGLSDTRDPAAALVIDDELVATSTAVRPARSADGAFPWEPLRDVLTRTGLDLSDIHRVVFGTVSETGAAPPGGRNVLGAMRKGARLLGQVALKETGTWVVRASVRRERETERLRELGFDGDVKTMEHAHSLATAAWRLQPVERALVITADSGGDGTAVTVSHGSNEGLRLIYRQGELSSLRNLDSAVARALGVAGGELGQLATYLAERGGVPAELQQRFAREFHASTGGFNLALTDRRRSMRRTLAGYAPEEIAAAYQANLERQFRRVVRHWVRRSGREQVVVAGDAFRNRGLIRSLLELDEIEDLFVAPCDGGPLLALAGALWYADLGPGYRPVLHLGPGWDDAGARAALKDAGLVARRPRGTAAKQVAQWLRDGEVVVRGAGGEPWGAQVQGRRSVLWQPGNGPTTARVERRLGRRGYELPTVLVAAEGAIDVGLGLDRASWSPRYGGVPLEVAPRWRERLTPVALADDTALFQQVDGTDSPALADLLQRVEGSDGGGVLLSTTLRLEGRPSPRTPDEIIGAFLASRLDHLWLGPYLVDHPDPA